MCEVGQKDGCKRPLHRFHIPWASNTEILESTYGTSVIIICNESLLYLKHVSQYTLYTTGSMSSISWTAQSHRNPLDNYQNYPDGLCNSETKCQSALTLTTIYQIMSRPYVQNQPSTQQLQKISPLIILHRECIVLLIESVVVNTIFLPDNSCNSTPEHQILCFQLSH